MFGGPKNRMRPRGANDAAAEAFCMQAGNLAARYGVHLALEANPPMYTNYLLSLIHICWPHSNLFPRF